MPKWLIIVLVVGSFPLAFVMTNIILGIEEKLLLKRREKKEENMGKSKVTSDDIIKAFESLSSKPDDSWKNQTCGTCAWFNYDYNLENGELLTGVASYGMKNHVGVCRRASQLYPLVADPACPAWVVRTAPIPKA